MVVVGGSHPGTQKIGSNFFPPEKGPNFFPRSSAGPPPPPRGGSDPKQKLAPRPRGVTRRRWRRRSPWDSARGIADVTVGISLQRNLEYVGGIVSSDQSEYYVRKYTAAPSLWCAGLSEG